MVYLKVQSSFIDEINNNTFLKQKNEEFKIACEKGTTTEFLDENPDFFQMMMHLCQDERVKIVYEEGDEKLKPTNES